MLMQSDGKTITLLPALPKEWSEGSVSGIRARGGCEIAMEWKASKVTGLKISSKTNRKLTIYCNGEIKTVKMKAGKTTTII